MLKALYNLEQNSVLVKKKALQLEQHDLSIFKMTMLVKKAAYLPSNVDVGKKKDGPTTKSTALDNLKNGLLGSNNV